MDAWVMTDHGPALIELQDVLFVEQLTKTLISIKRLTTRGYQFHFGRELSVTNQFGHTFVIPQRDSDDIYYFTLTEPNAFAPNIRQAQLELFRLHLALGHPSFPKLTKIIKALNVTSLLGKNLKNPDLFCSTCKVAKTIANQVPTKSPSFVTRDPFSALHFDNLVGMTPTPAGKTGYSFCVDRATHFVHVELIRHKSESKDHIRRMHQFATSFGFHVKLIMSDSAPELFVDKELRSWLNERGTRNKASAPYAQYQNGYCETHVQIIMHMALSALITSGLPKSFWGEALLWAVDTWNRSPHVDLAMKTPLQTLTRHTPERFR